MDLEIIGNYTLCACVRCKGVKRSAYVILYYYAVLAKECVPDLMYDLNTSCAH